MSVNSASAAASFTVTCPACGQKLRFLVSPEMPVRIRIQCYSCKSAFGVRRPGADPAEVTQPGINPPTLVGMPVQATGQTSLRPLAAGEPTSPIVRSVPVQAPVRREAAPSFAPGTLVAERYRIVRFIARGGMGEVYEVEDLELRERVALKTVRPEVAHDEMAIERFKREIQLARRVTHPNVCRIFDVSHHRPDGNAAGVIFLTMELLQGETLAERLRRTGPLPPHAALPIVRQVSDALNAAHQVGVVHRDLKPGNVILAEGRGGVRAVVTDFGLARREKGEDAQGLTLTGAAGVVGTPAYLAPEQVEGKPATPAVDIYALGIVLYEMLTGTVPFLGDSALSTAVKRLQEAPPSPRVHVPGLAANWEAAILRCLAREPAARFATAPELVEALVGSPASALAALVPPSAPSAPAIPDARPAPPPQRRNRLQLGIFAALVLVAVAVGAIRFLQWRARQMEPRQRLALLTEKVTPRPSVAVLGFKNLTGTPGTEWLSAGLAEMLSTELASGGKLRIVAGENVARAKVELRLGDSESLARDTLARLRTLLGTDAVVLGSYATVDGPAGRTIRLDLRLQDTTRGETTARVAETASESELFALVGKAGERLRRELGAGADAGKVARVSLAASPEAARLYAEGIQKLRLFDPVGARDLLARAAAADPGNALAHSGLAASWAALGYDGKARAEAKAALDLAGGLPEEEKLLIQGRYYETVQDWGQAVEIYWNLFSLFPDNLDHGLRLAAAQTAAGRAEEALDTAQALRSLPAPTSQDPRIDLAEAAAAGARADFKRQQAAAARASARGTAQGSPLLVAQSRLLECRALRNLGQAEKALAACEEGRRLYADAGDRSGVAEALTHAANVLYDRGDLPGADGLYEQALATYRELGNRGGEAGALNNIAVVLKSQGNLSQARENYRQVLDICREIGSRSGEAFALNNLAGVLVRRGELEEAEKLFTQALAIRRELGDRGGEAYALDNLGVVLRQRGNLSEARARHEESLRIRREIGQKIGEVASLNNLGTVLLEQGELEAARRNFQSSLALCRETGNRSASAYSFFGLGEVLARGGDLEEARKRHQAALSLREELGEKGTAAESRLALANLMLDSGEAAPAERLARTAADELARQGNEDTQALALSTAALAAAAQGDAIRASQTIDQAALLLGAHQDLRARLLVEIRAARLGRSPRPELALDQVIQQAEKAGLLGPQLEAQLALGKLEIEHGRIAEGRERLATLQREANTLGYKLIARKAASQ
ncbi:MAG TPA: tetratricopeptide repeat-containing serine/threonine-protein kinase [Thermoanaerobaculia bacterium]|nr:tetratricopeptide repeat-containing serine/threonine-protein kinase [Thermoanaerobaculia bacterium]